MKKKSTFDAKLIRRAVAEAFVKLDPRAMWRNPVMFLVEVGALLTTLLLFLHFSGFALQIAFWLWATVLFANFAEGIAEGRGKAQADTLRKTKTETTARRLVGTSRTEEQVSASSLRKGDLVMVEANQIIPGDGTVIEGIASVNEWANALDAGASCIALRRNPQPDEQDLNVPRCLFDGSGIDEFQHLTFDERVDFLGKSLRGTAPQRRGWAAKIKHGRDEGRFEEAVGEVMSIDPGPAGLTVRLKLRDGSDPGPIDVTGIVCGTGFVKSALALPVVRRLVQTYDVPIEYDRVRLKTNCGVPPLDRDDSRLCMMGLAANTVVPNGDTIASR